MKCTAGSLRADRSAPAAQPGGNGERDSRGFIPIDGLPDLEVAPSGGADDDHHRFDLPRLTTGDVATGLGAELKDRLARGRANLDSGRSRAALKAATVGETRGLTVYELEAAEAMTTRRDAAVNLQTVLADDIAQYEGGMAAIRAGLAKDMLAPAVGGSIRRSVSDAMNELEAARHRFRLALVAVAVDNGMNAGQVGEAFGFSCQLASRYLKEARAKWPARYRARVGPEPGPDRGSRRSSLLPQIRPPSV